MPRSWVVSEIKMLERRLKFQHFAISVVWDISLDIVHSSLYYCVLFWKPIERLNSKLKENMKCKFVKGIDKPHPGRKREGRRPLKGQQFLEGGLHVINAITWITVNSHDARGNFTHEDRPFRNYYLASYINKTWFLWKVAKSWLRF